jgi:hypothetical protein
MCGQEEKARRRAARASLPEDQRKELDHKLLSAAFKSEPQKLKHCLELGADANAMDGDGETALMFTRGQNCAVILLESGADPDFMGVVSKHALIRQIMYGHKCVAEIINNFIGSDLPDNLICAAKMAGQQAGKDGLHMTSDWVRETFGSPPIANVAFIKNYTGPHRPERAGVAGTSRHRATAAASPAR